MLIKLLEALRARREERRRRRIDAEISRLEKRMLFDGESPQVENRIMELSADRNALHSR